MERPRKEGAALAYRCAKQHSERGSDKRGAKVDELHLTPLELIARIAVLAPTMMSSNGVGMASRFLKKTQRDAPASASLHFAAPADH